MGNVISTFYDAVDHGYDKYYPKNKWLQPVFVSSALMASHIGIQLVLVDAKCAVVPTNSYNFFFLFSVAGNLGINLWVSFVQGLTMMRLLPRHQFGLVQSHLFPKYFFLTTAFSFGSLATYLGVKPYGTWKGDSLVLGGLLATSFLLSALNFTCFSRNAIKYNLRMHQIEKNAGEGITTIGKLMQDSKVQNDPEYVQVKNKFYRFHGYSLSANFITVASAVAQIYLLSRKTFFSF